MRTRDTIVGFVVAVAAHVALGGSAAAQLNCRECLFDDGTWECAPSSPGFQNCQVGATSCTQSAWCAPTLASTADLQADGALSLRRTARNSATPAILLDMHGGNRVSIADRKAAEGRHFRRACNGMVLERHYSKVIETALRRTTKNLTL